MPRRLTLVIHSLAGGGAERMAVTLAGGWAERGHDVTLITLDARHSDRYQLDGRVDRVALGVMRESTNVCQAWWNNRMRVRALRDAIRRSRPDKVVSITDKTNVLTLLACRKLDVDVIVNEQVDLRRHSIGRFWSWLRRRTYPRCRALVILSQRSRDDAQRLVRNRPVYVIPNAISVVKDVAIAEDDDDKLAHRVVGMGRLDPQKGFDLLIDAFSQIAAKHPRWRLQILGEGPQRAGLARLIALRNLRQRVELLGWVDEPSSVLRQCDLFVLSSRYEGIPLALLEAMACGLPAISFDCETGPAEIIRPEVDGLLAPAENVAALRDAMDRLMSNPAMRKKLAQRAPEATQRFGMELYLQRWEAVLDGVDTADFANIR